MDIVHVVTIKHSCIWHACAYFSKGGNNLILLDYSQLKTSQWAGRYLNSLYLNINYGYCRLSEK